MGGVLSLRYLYVPYTALCIESFVKIDSSIPSCGLENTFLAINHHSDRPFCGVR